MFIHLLAGSLIFLLFGKFFDIEITRNFLLLGAFWGILPDPVSYILSRAVVMNKWAHTHRDNISHSVFLYLGLLAVSILFDYKMGILASLAMLTHPFCDLYGIGWGVKLFYPLSNKTYKLFYNKQILSVWTQKETNAHAEKSGDDHWIKNIYFKPNIVGATEWLSLAGFLVLVFIG